MEHFETPYSKKNKIRRLLWTISWNVLARPFPKSTLMPWKRFLLRMFGAKVHSTANVYATCKVFMPSNLIMDEGACLAEHVDCYNAAPIHLKKDATVSTYSYLCTASHNISSLAHEQTEAPIIIGERAWVCAGAFVGPGVNVGDWAVVGARAAVFKDVDPWTVVGGNPAQFIKKRELKK